MKIDAHHHFWCYNPAEYGWIDDSMAVLRRDFLPDDLRARNRSSRHRRRDHACRPGSRSTKRAGCCELAAEHSFVKGVVGWVPLCDPDVKEHLGTLAHCHTLEGGPARRAGRAGRSVPAARRLQPRHRRAGRFLAGVRHPDLRAASAAGDRVCRPPSVPDVRPRPPGEAAGPRTTSSNPGRPTSASWPSAKTCTANSPAW